MTREHGGSARIGADQFVEPPADLHGGVAVVGQGQDAPRILAAHAE